VVLIDNKLDFKLFKNNNLKINKNGIAYSKKNDRILFELDNNVFKLLMQDGHFELEKESNDNIFKLNQEKATIYLKEHDLLLPIIVEGFSISNNNNKYIITYQLETDDEHTTIEIIL